MCFHMIPAPTVAYTSSLISRSRYNTKLTEYFNQHESFLSPLTLAGEHAFSLESESFGSKELKRLKFLSSDKFYSFFVLGTWSFFGLVTLILEGVVCKGWIKGNKCAFEEIGVLALQSTVLVGTVFAGIQVLAAKFKYNSLLEAKFIPKQWNIAFFGITAGAVQVLYDLFWYDPAEEIYIFPFVFSDIAFMGMLLGLFYPLFVIPCKTKSLNSSLDTDGLTLQDILQNKASRTFFQAFLVENLCVENLLFIQYLYRFKEVTPSHAESFAQHVFKKFIAEGSIGQINISAKARNQAKTRIELNNAFPEMFKEAEEQVILLLTYDSLPKFKASNYYSQLVHHYFG
eukprot:snap_masked-scaffold_2-processed-gene-18.34-mRNA-1 protein AED:1.00 eAED:1.00 QI:0/0/0/0/1/1/2/0/342